MKVKFLADASLDQAIVTGLRRREPTVDFLSANEAGLEGVHDQEVLALATQAGRILVTADRKTMPGQFGEFIVRHGRCSGVFLVSQKLSVASAIDSLLLIWLGSEAEEWENRICSIPF